MSPALFWDSQSAQLPLQLTGNTQLQKKSEKHKNVVTHRVHVLHVASEFQSLGPTNPNHLTGQNPNEPQNHILLLNPPQFATRNIVASSNDTATRSQADWELNSLTIRR